MELKYELALGLAYASNCETIPLMTVYGTWLPLFYLQNKFHVVEYQEDDWFMIIKTQKGFMYQSI